MYTGLLHTHNLFRWLVLLAALIAIILAFTGWFGKRNWKKADNISGLLLVIFVDLQLLIGIVLYAFISPITRSAFADFGSAMKNDTLRFYAIEHFVMMLIALVLIHIGRSKSKKATDIIKKHRNAAIFFSLGLLIILAGIPWDRALF
jgi:hypothetical protein